MPQLRRVGHDDTAQSDVDEQEMSQHPVSEPHVGNSDSPHVYEKTSGSTQFSSLLKCSATVVVVICAFSLLLQYNKDTGSNSTQKLEVDWDDIAEQDISPVIKVGSSKQFKRHKEQQQQQCPPCPTPNCSAVLPPQTATQAPQQTYVSPDASIEGKVATGGCSHPCEHFSPLPTDPTRNAEARRRPTLGKQTIPKILYMVLTYNGTRDRALALQLLEGDRADFMFFGNEDDPTLSVQVHNPYTCKELMEMSSFNHQHAVDHGCDYLRIFWRALKLWQTAFSLAPQYEWFVRLSDDSYVVPEHMEKVLSEFDPMEPYAIGKVINLQHGHLKYRPFVATGTAVALSRGAVSKWGPSITMCKDWFHQETQTYPKGREFMYWADDVITSQCMQEAGVRIVHHPGFLHFAKTTELGFQDWRLGQCVRKHEKDELGPPTIYKTLVVSVHCRAALGPLTMQQIHRHMHSECQYSNVLT